MSAHEAYLERFTWHLATSIRHRPKAFQRSYGGVESSGNPEDVVERLIRQAGVGIATDATIMDKGDQRKWFS